MTKLTFRPAWKTVTPLHRHRTTKAGKHHDSTDNLRVEFDFFKNRTHADTVGDFTIIDDGFALGIYFNGKDFCFLERTPRCLPDLGNYFVVGMDFVVV